MKINAICTHPVGPCHYFCANRAAVCMSAMTIAGVLILASQCQSLVAPMNILKSAIHESHLDPQAIHHNVDGSTDRGLMQINDRNWTWLNHALPGLNLNAQTALNPCTSIRAGAFVLASLSAYNTGSTTKGIRYAMDVQGIAPTTPEPAPAPVEPSPSPSPCPTSTDDGWHTPALPPGCPHQTEEEPLYDAPTSDADKH